MKIIITGSGGLIGSSLKCLLESHEHQVIALKNQTSPSSSQEPFWDYRRKTISLDVLEEADAVIHLAGENIAAHRWTPSFKTLILESRINGTQFLCESLLRLKHPPKLLICASATGYYGDAGDKLLTEYSSKGEGFLADCCEKWEQASKVVQKANIRVVNLRFGMVLSAKGGALQKLLAPFKLGMGGHVGDGRQYISWIAIDDLLKAVEYVLSSDQFSGPINFVTPHPVTNKEFTETLGQILEKPTAMTLPAFAARMLFGEMADDVLLASQRVMPEKLLSSGFSFSFPSLQHALHHLLKNCTK